MRYALLGDIHSSKQDLEKVLADILAKAPGAELMGTGDLFECIISKKNITDNKFTNLEEVMLIPEGFPELLRFPSVSGNQEDRILWITETDNPLRAKLAALPETIEMGHAKVMHGHQWRWGGEPWALVHESVEQSFVFYGHSHQSGLSINGVQQEIEYGIPYSVEGEKVLVNVGVVIGDCEWLLYDVEEQTVTFMKV
ncbi:metallophosphoesterase family protein [Sporosarcina beigongshangi]|uniref:metallophosphoesterase family protein n=1 Tax=Sporosarcina beigongshangi TaxID=2782538 RepID=UPI001939C06B|nr:metallophosphoesterase family protein [Sporosarcina beigongshangi]